MLLSMSKLRSAGLVATFAASALALLTASASVGAAANYQSQPPPTPQPNRPILLTDPLPDPKQSGVQYFAPTGHTLRGSFLDYWQRNGGLAQFGYPLTEEFTEPIGPNNAPIMVQYFERNRFEHHPENAGTPYEVLLGVLGREFHPQDPPATFIADRLYFKETGHSLAGTFKEYWDNHGGLAIHGFPITEQFEEKNPLSGKLYTVQYFERSRFELHPENAGGPYEVLLGQLGVQLSQKKGYPYGWYPVYGRAASFSWVAGKPRPKGACFSAECSCTFVNEPTAPASSVEPVGAVWQAFVTTGALNYGTPTVFFGHFPNPSETVPQLICPRTPYVVDRVQLNPAK